MLYGLLKTPAFWLAISYWVFGWAAGTFMLGTLHKRYKAWKLAKHSIWTLAYISLALSACGIAVCMFITSLIMCCSQIALLLSR